MNELFILTRIELASLFSVNKFRFTKDKKEKKRYILLSSVIAFLILYFVAYVAGLVYGLCYLGLSDTMPIYLTLISSLIVLFFGIFKVGSTLFSSRVFDILASMPLKTYKILLSRFIRIYAEDFIFSAVIIIPGSITYGLLSSVGVSFYLLSLLTLVFIPAIPLAFSALVETFVYLIACRVKHKSLVQSLIMVIVIVGVIAVPMLLSPLLPDEFSSENFFSLVSTVADFTGKIYPPAIWLSNALLNADLLSLLLFISVSVAFVALIVLLSSFCFDFIRIKFSSVSTNKNYKINTLSESSILKSLFIKEARRYFSSSIYVTNTIVGPIMGVIMSVAFAVVGIDKISSLIPFDLNINAFLPFLLSAVTCMMTVTSTSISMEGKEAWIIKTIPISSKSLFDAKLLFNLCLISPFLLVSLIILSLTSKAGFIDLLFLIVIPLLILFFSCVLGIGINIRFHSFDWDKEETIVKQSLSSALGGFAGFFSSIVLALPLLIVSENLSPLLRLFECVILSFLTLLLYNLNNKTKLETL